MYRSVTLCIVPKFVLAKIDFTHLPQGILDFLCAQFRTEYCLHGTSNGQKLF